MTKNKQTTTLTKRSKLIPVSPPYLLVGNSSALFAEHKLAEKGHLVLVFESVGSSGVSESLFARSDNFQHSLAGESRHQFLVVAVLAVGLLDELHSPHGVAKSV